ncbi:MULTISPECIES: hypothetical protein [Streptomyces]|uniref:Integral membrane protein n=1 Tax=Streptomyces ramulosus TaxID=47762 RepID=A0ABW1FDP5_9ACTN
MVAAALVLAALLALTLLTRRSASAGRRPARVWALSAIVFLILTFGFAVRGATAMFAWDIEETCRLQYGQDWSPQSSHESVIPMSRTCNAHYDLVPSYVNPAIAACAAGAVASAVVATSTAVRDRRRRRDSEQH